MNFKFKRGLAAFLAFIMALCLLFAGCEEVGNNSDFNQDFPPSQNVGENVDDLTEKVTKKPTNNTASKDDEDFEDDGKGDTEIEEDKDEDFDTKPSTEKAETEKPTQKPTNPTEDEGEDTADSDDITDIVDTDDTVDAVDTDDMDDSDNADSEDYDDTASDVLGDTTDNVTDDAIESGTNDATESGTNDATEGATDESATVETEKTDETEKDYSADPPGIPPYSGTPYYILNSNHPEFLPEEITTKSYEFYSELDSLGRCGYTMACIGKDLMPTEDRGSISSVKPSGWVNKTYDASIVSGGYIYNRCHLIGFQLTGENANKKNLITGTKYLNINGMLPFENMVADYVKETDNHVMYRVTPIYVGDNLVASGVQIEAYSVEDNGDGICFNVYLYNVQPQITIDYATGDNWLTNPPAIEPETEAPETAPSATEASGTESGAETDVSGEKYVLNTDSKKIHIPTCSYATKISSKNRQEYRGDLTDLINSGYTACGVCKPLQ